MKSYEILLLIIFVAVWIYLLTVFKRKKLSAFYFMTGTAGFFLIMFSTFKSLLAQGCAKVICFVLDLLSNVMPLYTIYKEYNIIFIDHNNASISLFIDYECSGVIEILVITAVVLFFPLFNKKQKAFYIPLGIFYTMVANIIRLLSIITIVYRYGNNSYYLAHSVIGRIIFYILTLFLYFYMLSWKQIKAQKVGRFKFETNKLETKNKVEVKG